MKLNELFEESGKEVAIIFGRFNPPHVGHVEAWKKASESPLWYIGTNQTTVGPTDPLPYDVKVAAMEAMMPEIAGHIVSEQSWWTLATYVYKKHGEVTLYIVTDEKDAKIFVPGLKDQNGKESKHGYYNFKSIEWRPADRITSATDLRTAVLDNDKTKFAKAAGVDADKEVMGMPFFDLVAKYLLPYSDQIKAKAERAAKKKSKEAAEDVEEGWKSKVAGAALAAANLLGSPAQAAEEPVKPITIAHVIIDGEVRKYNLGDKFSNAKEAEEFISKILDKQGLQGYQLDIKHGYPKEKKADKEDRSGFNDEYLMKVAKGKHPRPLLSPEEAKKELEKRGIKVGESIEEGEFRKRDVEEKLISNNKLNDLKSKYLPDWEMLDHRILQAKYVAKDHRHAEEFVSYINKISEKMDHFAEVTQDVSEVTVKTTTFDVKGLTILDFKLALKVDKYADANEIEQVRMQGNFGMHESNYGRYWCSTDKKWKYRKGPKQKRS